MHIHYLPADRFSSDRLVELEKGHLDPGMLVRLAEEPNRSTQSREVCVPLVISVEPESPGKQEGKFKPWGWIKHILLQVLSWLLLPKAFLVA